MPAAPLQRCAAPGIPAAFPPLSIVPLCPAHRSCPTTALLLPSPFIQRQNPTGQILGKQARTPPPTLPSCRGHPCTRCLEHRSVPALSFKDQVQNCLHIVVGNSSKLSAQAWPFALWPGFWHLHCRNWSSAKVKSDVQTDPSIFYVCGKTHVRQMLSDLYLLFNYHRIATFSCHKELLMIYNKMNHKIVLLYGC